MSSLARPATLLILDGWNIGAPSETNAFHMAKTPVLDALMERWPNCMIDTSGLNVGLPVGQMGNSEVGHMNLGAGRVVYQDITRIDRAVADHTLMKQPALDSLMKRTSFWQTTLHLMGLVSDGGVHSSLDHLIATIREACERGIPVRLHVFLDGRDTPPRAGVEYIRRLCTLAEECEERGRNFAIASIGGRYWGMDRDQRWDRVEKHWRAIVLGDAPPRRDPVKAINDSYDQDVGDEFMEPVVMVDEDGFPLGSLEDGDSVFFFNFRSDRARQIVRAIGEPRFDGFKLSRIPAIKMVTMTSYNADFHFPVAFEPQSMKGIFADVMSENGLRNLRLAETEKYAHVTFFFNSGLEKPWPGEERILVPSPKVATYDLQPEMSLPEVTTRLLDQIQNGGFDFHIANFANCDMVGHTGIMKAGIAAVEAVDEAVGRVLEAVRDKNGFIVVTADHGNIEKMWDERTNAPHTAHTNEPVPLVMLDELFKGELADGKLADVIPTLLHNADLQPSEHMNGRDLRRD